MYYGGPTEVLWHASSRVNCGITHFITGRDPAGVKHPEDNTKDLYDVWHGQKLLVNVKSMLNGVEVLPFKVAAYDTKAKAMAFYDPHRKEDFDFISGTRMRSLARSGETPPAGFMAPQVRSSSSSLSSSLLSLFQAWTVLCEYYQSLQETK